MRLNLTRSQVERAVRDFLADPPEGDIAVRIPEDTAIRVAVRRDGGLNVYTGDEANAPGSKPTGPKQRLETESAAELISEEEVQPDAFKPIIGFGGSELPDLPQ